ncbi:acetylserotonin O-methyltransferase isoform X2 [Canis lupus familiaris]|nr:acetylserotonin O-methyltransferase isoform X2 [Canis lupus familiaris]XP_038304845.1 acetylserotonin O-methyltransferase isoform X2 [Canis lupus familiaris]XP_038442394.1 acetylserotonin O-methyltransferase isoform X2 [Canis lupus familiaris]|eukprot:XP_022271751.1 acetylserotonin O-methyltransferase isoform X2 [Canis lupus familiaris]
MSSPEEQAFRLLTEYSNGFMVSQVLFAACELGVFDLLAEAPEPLGAAAVAARLGTSSHGTELLLDTCVSLKLLQVETKTGKALYQNTELSSTYLVRASPKCQGNMLRYLARTTYLCWGHLTQAVRDGRNQYLEAFGVPSDQLFSAIYRSEDERLQFMRGLQDVWSVSGRPVLGAFDLSPFPLICDVGGDFFKDPLPEADLYILARVLHDWTDERCSRLLARIHGACKPGGGVLVIESLLAADGRGPLTAQLYSLNMLVQTEGRERTPAQYRALLAAAGFRHVQCRRTGGLYDAILATR